MTSAVSEFEGILGVEFGTALGSDPAVLQALATLARVQCGLPPALDVGSLQQPFFALTELTHALRAVDVGFGATVHTRTLERVELASASLAGATRWATTIDAVERERGRQLIRCRHRALAPDLRTPLAEVERVVVSGLARRHVGIGEGSRQPERSSPLFPARPFFDLGRALLGLADDEDANAFLALSLLPLAGSRLGLCDARGWRHGKLKALEHVSFGGSLQTCDRLAISLRRQPRRERRARLGFTFRTADGRAHAVGALCF